MAPNCWSCHDQGTGTWCSVCQPKLDIFGCEIPTGRRGTWMQTYSGGKYWPLSPRAEDVMIADIAIGLARECRYGKQSTRFYSVAEHSVIVSLLVEEIEPAFAREALLHDCDEGMLPDMPRPVKHDPEMNLEGFRACGKLFQCAAFERFHIRATEESHGVIDTIDKRLVVDEVRAVMRDPAMYLERHQKVQPIGCMIGCLSTDDALTLFLSRFAELFPEELSE